MMAYGVDSFLSLTHTQSLSLSLSHFLRVLLYNYDGLWCGFLSFSFSLSPSLLLSLSIYLSIYPSLFHTHTHFIFVSLSSVYTFCNTFVMACGVSTFLSPTDKIYLNSVCVFE